MSTLTVPTPHQLTWVRGRGFRRAPRRARIVLLLVAAVVAGTALVASTARADVLPTGGMSAAQVAAMFNTYGDAGDHWTGGDSTASVLLPDGRLVWLFSDTFLGTVNADGTRPNDSPMVTNSMVIQDGSSLVATLHGGAPGAPGALAVANQPGEMLWVADGIVEGGALKVLYNRYRRYGDHNLDVELMGTSLVTYALPALNVSSVVDLPVGRTIAWGSALLVDGSYTYIYGASTGLATMKFAHLARVPVGNLGGAWQFWTGSAWSTNVAAAARVLSGVGTAYGVQKVGTQYVLITQENNAIFDPQIVAYTATAPTGPFTGPIQLFTAPEQQPGREIIVYDSRLHPELARTGKLLVSYNVNSLSSPDVFADARLYRPRFVEVDWPRPQPGPGSLPPAPTGLTVTGDSAGVAHLSWTSTSGATGYRIHRRDVTGGQSHFARGSVAVTQTSTTLHDLIPAHRYEFKITAANSVGEGPFSTVASLTPRVARDASVIRYANTPEAVPGQYIVRFKDSAALRAAGVPAFADELTAQAGGQRRRLFPLTLKGFSASLTQTQAIDLVGHPDVLDVEQDQRWTLAGEQSDPPWGLDRIDQRSLPLDQRYRYPNVGGVHAFVLDTGVRITHQEFGGRASYGKNAIDGSMNSADCTDPAESHGTHVAAVLGGATYGVAKGAKIVSVKVVPCGGQTDASVVLDGVEWVISEYQNRPEVRPAVMNLSVGGPARAQSGTLEVAIRKAVATGVTVVASAGNDNADACTRSPAREPAVITVANVQLRRIQGVTEERRYFQSNYGPCVDIFAPGTDIISAVATNDTGASTFTGTSMATPHVAGAAAMVLASHPGFTPAQVWQTLQAAGTPGVVADAGAGSPNRLLFVEQPPTHAPTNLAATTNPDGTIGLRWDPVPEPNVHYLVSQRDVTAGETAFTRWADPIFSGTTATASNLMEGHTYEFTVAASNSGGIGPESNVASAVARTAPPGAPTNLTATANADGTIRLTWTAPGPNLWYWVYQRDITAQETEFTRLPLPITTCCSLNAGYLTHDHEYEYKVTATNRGGEGPPSNLARARSRYPVPAPPTGLTASAGNGQVVLSWSASPTPNVWYWVYQRDVTAGEAEFTKLPLPVTTCCTMTAGFLANTHTYEFQVTATGQGGESIPSNRVQATPLAPLPGPITGLTATANTDGTITLNWTEPPGGPYWFDVYMRDVTAGEANFTKIPLPVTTCCTWTAMYLTHNHTYEFKVAAINGRSGPLSGPVQATCRYTPPGAPRNLRGFSSGDGFIELNWDPPGAGGLMYWVYYRDVTAQQTEFTRTVYPTEDTSARLGPLVHGHVYEFKVSAANQGGEGPASTPIQVTSRGGLPLPPSGLTATAGDRQAVLRWTASPTSNVLYIVHFKDTNAPGGGSWQQLPLPVSGTTVTVTPLTNGNTYQFKVTASNASGTSAPSNIASARPLPPLPQPPTGLTGQHGDSRATLRWTASTTPNVYYWIEMRPSNGSSWQRLEYPVTTCCTFVAQYLVNGRAYEFRVRATNLTGDSAPSNVVIVRPLPPPPQPPTGLGARPGDSLVELIWNPSPTPNVWYWIEMRVQNGTWRRLPYPYAGCCRFIVNYLVNGTTYDFRVRATNVAGDSEPSLFSRATPSAQTYRVQEMVFFNLSSDYGGVYAFCGASTWIGITWSGYVSTRTATSCVAAHMHIGAQSILVEDHDWLTNDWQVCNTLPATCTFISANTGGVRAVSGRTYCSLGTAYALPVVSDTTPRFTGRDKACVRF